MNNLRLSDSARRLVSISEPGRRITGGVISEMITAFYVVHAALAILLGVFLIVRLFSAIFSERIRSQIGKHLGLHVFLVVACVFLIMPYRNPNYYGPPYWMVRREERQQVFERVEAAGGWSALRAACTNLVVQAKEEPVAICTGDEVLPTRCRQPSPPYSPSL